MNMAEQHEKGVASGGGLEMPMSLGAATGAVTITAAGDQRATETKIANKKKKGCCWKPYRLSNDHKKEYI